MNEMNITSAQYVSFSGKNISVRIIINNQTLDVPLDSANRHYAEIMRQVEAGELTIADAD
jgi:hypothetical protein